MSNRKPWRKSTVGLFLKKFDNRFLGLRRQIYTATHSHSEGDRRNLFVFGCQRSGTTLLGQVFRRDLRTAVLQEGNSLTGIGEGRLRMRPLPEVRQLLNEIRPPLVVVKPLVESFRADEILQEIPSSKGIWMLRTFKDVVASNIKLFSSQIEALKITITGDPPSWRNAWVSDSTREILERFYRPDMPVQDAAALGWYKINIVYFEKHLSEISDLAILHYEKLCRQPESTMRQLYEFIDMPYPKWQITGEVDSRSLRLGKKVEISAPIEEICSELEDRFLSRLGDSAMA